MPTRLAQKKKKTRALRHVCTRVLQNAVSTVITVTDFVGFMNVPLEQASLSTLVRSNDLLCSYNCVFLFCAGTFLRI